MEKFKLDFGDSVDILDVSKSEVSILRQIYSKENIDETIFLYVTIAILVQDYYIKSEKTYIQLLKEANEFFDGGKYRDSIEIITKALFFAPDDYMILKYLFLKRAKCYMELNLFEKAVLNLVILDCKISENFELEYERVQILTRAYILLNDKQNAKLSFDLLQSYTHNTQFNKANKNEFKTLKKLLSHMKYVTLTPTYKNVIPCKPYKGYSQNSRLMRASSACSLINNKTSASGYKVLANQFIPKTEVVILDKPFVKESLAPNLNCDVCNKFMTNFIFCFICRFCSYCSLECKLIDEKYHKYECRGLRIYLFFILKSRIEIRTLIKGIEFMKQEMFETKEFRNCKTADDLFVLLSTISNKSTKYEYCNILNMPTNYNKLNILDYELCLSNAVRSIVYLKHSTSFFEDFFLKYIKSIPQEEIEIFLAALIMRHTAQFIYNNIELIYTMEGFVNSVTKITQNQENCEINAIDVAKFYEQLLRIDLNQDINFSSLKKNTLKRLRKVQLLDKENMINVYFNQVESDMNARKTIHEENFLSDLFKPIPRAQSMFKIFVNECIDNAQNDLDNDSFVHMAKLNSTENSLYNREREKLMNRNILGLSNVFQSLTEIIPLHINTYSEKFQQTLKGIYPTASMLNHSCDPNVFIVMLFDGTILLRANRDILFGEEITISVTSKHFCDTCRSSRQQLLNDIYRSCNCKYCRMDIDYFEELNSYQCKQCNSVINMSTFVCYKCKSTMENGIGITTTLKNIFFMETLLVKDTTQSNFLYNLYVSNLTILLTVVSSKHIFVYKQQLKIFSFLANNNYIVDALEIYWKIKDNCKLYHPKLSFGLYNAYTELFEPLYVCLIKNQFNKEIIYENSFMFFEIHEICVGITNKMLEISRINFLHSNQSHLLWQYSDQLRKIKKDFIKIITEETMSKWNKEFKILDENLENKSIEEHDNSSGTNLLEFIQEDVLENSEDNNDKKEIIFIEFLPDKTEDETDLVFLEHSDDIKEYINSKEQNATESNQNEKFLVIDNDSSDKLKEN